MKPKFPNCHAIPFRFPSFTGRRFLTELWPNFIVGVSFHTLMAMADAPVRRPRGEVNSLKDPCGDVPGCGGRYAV